MDGPEIYWYFKLIEHITKFLFELGKDFAFIKEEGQNIPTFVGNCVYHEFKLFALLWFISIK